MSPIMNRLMAPAVSSSPPTKKIRNVRSINTPCMRDCLVLISPGTVLCLARARSRQARSRAQPIEQTWWECRCLERDELNLNRLQFRSSPRKRGPRGREFGQRTGSPLPRGRTEIGSMAMQTEFIPQLVEHGRDLLDIDAFLGRPQLIIADCGDHRRESIADCDPDHGADECQSLAACAEQHQPEDPVDQAEEHEQERYSEDLP